MIEKQFQVSYNMLSNIIKDVDEKQADFQLELAKNNIKWQLGHVIMANEAFVFGSEEEGNVLGEKLGESFSPGTSPQDFTGVEPTFQELKGILMQQLERILNALDDKMGQTRKQPVAGMATFDETISFAITHTNYHIGQINLMKNMLMNLDQGV